MAPIYGWDWFRDPDHQKGLNRFLISLLGSCCLTIALGRNQELQWIVFPLVMLVCLAHIVGWCWWVFQDSLKLRKGILSRIIPFLELRTEEERAYAEAVNCLVDLEVLSQQEKLEVVQSLNLVMKQLRSVQSDLLSASHGSTPEEVRTQILEIEKMISQCTDLRAKADLDAALASARSRLSKSHEVSPLQQRLNAQRVGLIQSLYSARDLLADLQTTGTEFVDTREMISRIEAVSSARSEIIDLEQR